MTEITSRNYLKGIIAKKWYSYVFIVGIVCFFLSISSMFVNNLFLEGIIDVSDWTTEQMDALVKWVGYAYNPGILILFYQYGNRLGLLLIGIAFFFGGLTDYTLPKEVRRSLMVAFGVALGGYLFAYLFYVFMYL